MDENTVVDNVSLMHLNTDCLMHIFSQLSLEDQHTIYNVCINFRQMITQIWRRKYANTFDYAEVKKYENSLTLKGKQQLWHTVVCNTKKLINLSAAACKELKEICADVGLPKLQSLHISAGSVQFGLAQLPVLCPQLKELEVDSCHIYDKREESNGIFRNANGLKHLQKFIMLPNSSCFFNTICDIKYCTALQCLRLPLNAMGMLDEDIYLQLPNLREVTLYMEYGDVGKDRANLDKSLSVLLGSTKITRQIKRLQFECQLDYQLMYLLVAVEEHCATLFALEEFIWHARIAVLYDTIAGCIRWRHTHDARVLEHLLKLITMTRKSLCLLDFMRNVHATPDFLSQVENILGDRFKRGEVKVLANCDSLQDVGYEFANITFEFA